MNEKLSEAMKASWAKRRTEHPELEEQRKLKISKAQKLTQARKRALREANPFKQEITQRSVQVPKLNKLLEQSISATIEDYIDATKTMTYQAFVEYRPVLINRIITIINQFERTKGESNGQS